MATLNFKRAYKFSITGGIYSEAQHVTMISSSADPRMIARDYRRRGRSFRSSRRRARTPSPSSSESSSISSDNSGQSSRSSPFTSVDEHESSLSQAVPSVSHARSNVLSPLSSRLGAMPGFTTPAHIQTPVASRPENLPHSPDIVTPVIIHRSNEAPTSAWTQMSPLLHRHSGRDVGVRPRPQGPRCRPLPHPPPFSQFVNHGTPVDLLSLTDSRSHTPESSSQPSSWDYFIQEPPHFSMTSSTAHSGSSTRPSPLQLAIPFSRRSGQADTFAPSPSYATNNDYPSRSSSSRAFLTSPIRESSVESMTSPLRRSVQSPPPIRRFQSIPLPPQSAPSRTSTASRSHVTSHSNYSTRSSRQAFWPSSTEQPYQIPVRSMNPSEVNVQPPISYQQALNSPNRDFIYIPPSGVPQQHTPRSP